ncbi:MAG: heavy metal-binding domain-containing protein [Pseudomonadales bacterium]
MIITTTNNIQGKRVTEYLGIVAGEAILGANIFRDMFAAIRDVVGGRSASYEKELGKARLIALEDLEDWAAELEADAVIGVDLDYESFDQTNGMMMVSATGTAVKLANDV